METELAINVMSFEDWIEGNDNVGNFSEVGLDDLRESFEAGQRSILLSDDFSPKKT